MAKRKSISKKIRFEVFKRDSFRCQYCGRGVSDGVLLEVDHIHPVAEGGTNEMFNLITACKECNQGKGKHKLSDKAVAEKESKFLEEEQARLEQAKLVIQWKEELMKQREAEITAIDNFLYDITGFFLNDSGRHRMRGLITRFGFEEVYTATEIALNQYWEPDRRISLDLALNKIGGICYNRRTQNAQKSN